MTTLIKRYPNRKLYDTGKKEYINLDGIAALIRAGEEIHVVDYASGEDLTALTLTQVLFDQARHQAGFLPRTVLAGLIQAGGSRLSAVQHALAHSMGFPQKADDEIRRRFQVLIDAGELDAEAGYRLMDRLLALGDPQGENPAVERPASEEVMERLLKERGLATHRDLQTLLDQIEALSARLDEMR